LSGAIARDNDTTVIGGGQIGCNYQTGAIVFGVEGDVDAQRWRDSRTLVAPLPGGATSFVAGDTFGLRSRWEASARARLGYAWDRWMIYATGGAAWTDVRSDVNFIAVTAGGFPFPADVVSTSKTRVGATVGGGLEYAFVNNWSFGVEGRYTWYGTQSFSGGALAIGATGTPAAPNFTFSNALASYKVNTAEVMAKVNYHFNWGSPVVASY
jgi:outer membrane immunogenic protein